MTVQTGIKPATLDKIKEELEFARARFPNDNMNFTALVEEVGELAKALIEHRRSHERNDSARLYYMREVAREAIQVAVMAIRVVEEGDCDYPWNPNELILEHMPMREVNG